MIGPLKIGETVFYVGYCVDMENNGPMCPFKYQCSECCVDEDVLRIFKVHVVSWYIDKYKGERMKLLNVYGWLEGDSISEKVFENYNEAKKFLILKTM